MRNICHEGLDEAHCLWALCSHPCCWEAEQRVAKGIYRRGIGKPAKHFSPVLDISVCLPSLTVVNVSEWTGRTEPFKGKQVYKTDISELEESINIVPGLPVLAQKESKQGFKSLDISSVSSSQTHGTKTRDVKLKTVQISPLIGSQSSWGSGSLVVWVPNPKYITPHCLPQKRSKTPRYAVKELICLPTGPGPQTYKVKEKPKGEKKRVRFQLATSGESVPASETSPYGEEQMYHRGTNTKYTPPATESKVNLETEDPRERSPLLLRNRGVFFHTVQDREVKKDSQGSATTLYKLDSKTGVEGVDWDSLRQQVYLWKRHHNRHKNCRDRLFPTGGASGPQEDFSLKPVSKVRPYHPLHSPLSVGPAVWPGVKGMWRYQQCSLPLMSKSKTLHSAAAETDTHSVCSSTAAMLHTEVKGLREKHIQAIVSPSDSELFSQVSNLEHKDRVCEGSVVQIGHSFSEDYIHSSDRSVGLITGATEPCREDISTDKGPEPTGFQLSTPPPSLDSL